MARDGRDRDGLTPKPRAPLVGATGMIALVDRSLAPDGRRARKGRSHFRRWRNDGRPALARTSRNRLDRRANRRRGGLNRAPGRRRRSQCSVCPRLDLSGDFVFPRICIAEHRWIESSRVGRDHVTRRPRSIALRQSRGKCRVVARPRFPGRSVNRRSQRAIEERLLRSQEARDDLDFVFRRQRGL